MDDQPIPINTPRDLELMLSDESKEPKALPLFLLEHITGRFSHDHEIGRGGFAVVYKGMLENGTIVAVKMLSGSLSVPDEKFIQEIRCLMKVKHKNVVRFLGYCANSQGELVDYNGNFVLADVRQRLLCFEYVPNGSLDEYIKGASCGLDWTECYQIINGICEGLHYLHQNHILHLDLKPANILLDGNMMPKITDFGLSRCFDEKQSRVITKNMAGTLGYVAPEFHGVDTYTLTYSSDIYSLGVIIIELLTGKRWYPDYPKVEEVLQRWRGRLGKSQQDIQLEQIRLCTELGIKCTDGIQENRPNTSRIISRLGKTKSTCILTSVQNTLENLEDGTNNMLMRNNVRLMNDSTEKNVTVGQWAAKNFPVAQECLDDNPPCFVKLVFKLFNTLRHFVCSLVQERAGPSRSTVEDYNLQEALRFIKHDSKVGMIGIWGPGGVGKTHLLNKINNSLDGDVTFNYVVHVSGSKGSSVEKIQADIVRKLNLTKVDDVDSQKDIIFDFLKEKNFLVLLDDLWDKIDLEAVGVPYPLGTVNKHKRKVVLTTRLRKVCGQMEVRRELKINYLQGGEAWQLFEEKLDPKTLCSHPYIETLAKKLVEELKGLPLALITIGRAMYAKDDPAHWEFAIQHMQQSCCSDKDKDPLDMEKEVFSKLKFSYDMLRNDTLRDCFLTCALWPEDWEIKKLDLAQCWIGLGLVNEHDMQSSYTKAYYLMSDLTAACLLESCGDWYGSVKMHDVIRDMAIWISCGCGKNNGKWFVRAGLGSDEIFSIPWSKVECISLMSNGMNKLPSFGFNPCPIELRTLCLGINRLEAENIAEAIKDFTSLKYLDLSSNNLKKIPKELCSLVNLEYLDLSGNRGIQEVPYFFRKLINLKFLYLEDTGIQSIPKEVISSLKALQVISPVYYNPIAIQELDTLDHLKEVGIVAEGFQYEALRRAASKLPIRKLRLWKLTAPEFYLSDLLSTDFAQRTLYELHFGGQSTMEQIVATHELGRHCFGILNKLFLSGLEQLKDIEWKGTSPASVFPRLTCLEVIGCYNLEHLSWVMYLPCLEHVVIEFCSDMHQAFIKTRGQESLKTFPSLKYLRLHKNNYLETFGGSDVTFPSLERLVLLGCSNLKSLPFRKHSLPLNLQKLQLDRVESWLSLRSKLEEDVTAFLLPRVIFSYDY